MTAVEFIGLMRDILLAVLAMVSIFAVLAILVITWVIYRKISPLASSGGRIAKHIEEATSRIRTQVIDPLLKGGGMLYTIGRIVGFLLGLGRPGGGKKNG